MNKEEIRKIINYPVIEQKVTDATNILMDLYELGFNNGLKVFQPQLDIANKKLEEIKEYCNEKLKWNRDDGNDYWAGKNNAQQQVSEDILSIIGGE